MRRLSAWPLSVFLWIVMGVVLASASWHWAAVHAAEKVTLRLAIADEKTPREGLEELFKPFEAANPDIDLEIVALYGSNIDKLTVEMMGGVAADVFTTYNEATVLSVRNGFYLDLAPFIQRDRFSLRDFLPATMALVTRDGRVYGLPQYQAVGAIYYNRQMMDEAGLPLPDGSWRWEEFARVAQRLTRFEGDRVTVTGYSQYPAWLWFFPWLVQAGVTFADPRVVPLDRPEAIQATDFVRDLVQRRFAEWQWGGGGFTQNRVAMLHSGAWELKYWVDAKVPMGLTAPPRGPGGQATLANTDIIGISSQSRHPEAAWRFLRWFFGRDVQRAYLQYFGLQPALLPLGGEWVQAVRDLYERRGSPQPTGLMAFVHNSAFAMPQPFFQDARVIGEDIMPALHRIMSQQAPTASTLQAAAEVATRKLREAR